MCKRILSLLVLVASSTFAEDPRLFIGVNLGTSLTSIAPVKQSGITPLTKILGGGSTITGAYNKEAYLEASDVTKNNISVIPTLGMSFPITNQALFEGSVSLDAAEKDFLVTNESRSNKVLAEITRDIGISASVLMRLSKQYSIGPLIEAHIITNKTPIFTGSTKQNYHTSEFGLQTNYVFHRYFTIGLICTTSIDQDMKVKDPDQSDSGKNDLTLELKRVRTALSLRLTPI